jgi:hypothetical protein
MRIEMQHPAIVTRRKRYRGEPDFAMVNTVSPIEVADYALGDAPAVLIVHHGAGDTTYRSLDGKLFKQLDFMSATALRPDAEMADALASHTSVTHFGSFMDIVEAWAITLETTEHPDVSNVSFLDVRLGKRERNSGIHHLMKAFQMAPPLAKQAWLDIAAPREVAEWRDRFEEFMGNVALVDGIVHVRCFEPCYRMRLGLGKRYNIEIDNMNVMSRWLGAGVRVDSRGIPELGEEWRAVDWHNFSLTERDRAVELADQFGFSDEIVDVSHNRGVTIIEPSALSGDFVKEEAYRLAVVALDTADKIANEVVGTTTSVSGDSKVATRLAEIARMEEAVFAAIQNNAHDAAAVHTATAALSETFVTEGEILSRCTNNLIAAVRKAIEFQGARMDAMPITVVTATVPRVSR